MTEKKRDIEETDKIIAELDMKVEFDPEQTEETQRKRFLEKINFKQLEVTRYIPNTKTFHQAQPFFYDRNKNFWFWSHKENRYDIVDETDVLQNISNTLNLTGELVTGGIKSAYLEAIKQVGRGKIPTSPGINFVQFKDILVNLETGEHTKASHKYFITNPIPHKLGISIETPNIDKIFKQWVLPEQVETLYEILAYCLIPDYPLHRIFVLHGAGMNGKGKYLELLSRLIGYSNRTSTELDLLMTNRFEVTKLYKKLACIIGETNFNTMTKTSLLKRLSGGDTIGFEHKNKNPFDDYNYAKIIIATNSLPVTMDKTIGFYRRFMIIDFPNQFTEARDVLRDIPDKEYENLCCKLLETLKRLLKERKFTNEGTVQERADKYEMLSNPLQRFIDEKTEEDVNGFIYKWEFLQEIEVFCKTLGYRLLDEREVGKYMKNANFETRRFSSPDGTKQWRAFSGIRMRNKNEISIQNTKSHIHTNHSIHPLSLRFIHEKSKVNHLDTMDHMDINFPSEMKVSELSRILDVIIDTKTPKEIENIMNLVGEKHRNNVDTIIQSKLSVGTYFSPKAGQVMRLE